MERGEPKMAPNSLAGWQVFDDGASTEEQVSELGEGGESGDPFAFIWGRRIYFPKYSVL